MSYRIRFHPRVAGDLDGIARRIADYAGPAVAAAKLAGIERTILGLADLPHRGSLRDEIAPGLRAIPAGRKGVVVFQGDDARREVLVYAVSCGGADRASRSRARRWGPKRKGPAQRRGLLSTHNPVTA